MANVIGIVGLAPGEVAYYDELTRIHLTLGRPTANVYDYMNTARLRRSVAARTLKLIAGTLNAVSAMAEVEDKPIAKKVVEKPVEKAKAIVEEVKAVEPVALAEEVAEVKEEIAEVKEEVAEETVEVKEEIVEVAAKKTTRRKKKEA